MKILSLCVAMAASVTLFAQGVSVKEETVSFSNGSHNALVVTIPHGNREVVEKELRSEMKDWGGKYNSSKGEMSTSQSSFKAMGEKMFDTYARILDASEGVIRVAVAVDLGGAYLENRSHSAQFAAMKSRLEKFAAKAATASVDEELEKEAKVLKGLEKEKTEMTENIEDAKKDIEEYKKKIADAEQRIKDNESGVVKKEEEIKTQTTKLSEIEAKKKAIK